jgi:hypothetical protein
MNAKEAAEKANKISFLDEEYKDVIQFLGN